MVIKNLENKIKLVTIIWFDVPCGVHTHQYLQHLDSKKHGG